MTRPSNLQQSSAFVFSMIHHPKVSRPMRRIHLISGLHAHRMLGILGLGFGSINTIRPVQQNTFFDNVKCSLASPIFTTTLKHQAPGSFDLGYIDAIKHTAPISYTEVDNSDGFWDITIDSYIVGKGSAITTGFHGAVDTGLTFLLLDDSVVITYYSQVEGAEYDYTQGGYTFACNTTLPDITFSTRHNILYQRLRRRRPWETNKVRCYRKWGNNVFWWSSE